MPSSALAILHEVDVDVRIAVNTGEALVKLDDRVELGATWSVTW
jgi:hypothetical protein